jgi:3-dehydroquinate dehydratase-2
MLFNPLDHLLMVSFSIQQDIHTSVAIGDAIAAIQTPVVEVHISNVHAREEFRKISHVSAKAKGTIAGLGLEGYTLALQYLIKI